MDTSPGGPGRLTVSGAAVRVDTTSHVPPYEQIRAQLAGQLAADLGLAAGTVARAYRELEAASLIRTRRGAGTRVAPLPAPAHRPDPAEIAALAREFVGRARALGATEEAVTAAVRAALRG